MSRKKTKVTALGKPLPPPTPADRADGWVNALMGIGTSRDRRMYSEFALEPAANVRDNQEQLWQGDDIIARIIEKPADEMMRTGFDITISDSDVAVATTEADTPAESASGKYDAVERVDRIRKTKNGRYRLLSHTGKVLGEFPTQAQAEARERQINYFKSRGDAFPTKVAPGAPPPFSPMQAPAKPPMPVPTDEDRGTKPVEDAVLKRWEELHGPERFLEALYYRRIYGGSAILVGANDGNDNLAEPLDLENIKELTWANVLTPREMQAVRYYGDPAEASYGEPMIFRVMPDINMNVDMSVSGGPTDRSAPIWVTREVHESRLIIFPGIVVSKRHRFRRHGWGDSVLARIYRVVSDFQMAYSAAAHLVSDFAQAILKIEGLADLIMQNDDDMIVKRAQLIDMSRSLARTVILDAKEDYERKATPVAGLSDLLQRFEHRLAAAADMPVSILMGREPSGLNASGDMELEAWYNTIENLRNRDLKPRLMRFLRLIMLSKDGPTKGIEPENWSIEFRPLQKANETEQADIRLKQSQVDTAYITAGVLTPEEVAASRFGGPEWSDKTTIDVEGREQQAKDFQDKQEQAEDERQQANKLALKPPTPTPKADADELYAEWEARLDWNPNQARNKDGTWSGSGSGGGHEVQKKVNGQWVTKSKGHDEVSASGHAIAESKITGAEHRVVKEGTNEVVSPSELGQAFGKKLVKNHNEKQWKKANAAKLKVKSEAKKAAGGDKEKYEQLVKEGLAKLEKSAEAPKPETMPAPQPELTPSENAKAEPKAEPKIFNKSRGPSAAPDDEYSKIADQMSKLKEQAQKPAPADWPAAKVAAKEHAVAVLEKHLKNGVTKENAKEVAADLEAVAQKASAAGSVWGKGYTELADKLRGSVTPKPKALPKTSVKTHVADKSARDIATIKGQDMPLSQLYSERKAFAASLTPDEKAAVLKYSGSSYKDINKHLRNDKPPTDLHEQIDAAIAKAKAPADIVVHRGLFGSYSKQLYAGLKPGDQIVEKGYSSTSAGGHAAFQGETELHITVPKGYPAAPIPSHSASENEILLRRNTKFQVTKIEHDPKTGKVHAHLTVVHDEL